MQEFDERQFSCGNVSRKDEKAKVLCRDLFVRGDGVGFCAFISEQKSTALYSLQEGCRLSETSKCLSQ
jgi:hypothetical protein